MHRLCAPFEGPSPGAARAATSRGAGARVYTLRRPEDGVLRSVVREHLETFLAEVRARTDGAGVPPFVERDLRESLACGELARGFARLRCETCRAEHLLPFSCKARAACSSCAGRRMAERAADLVDRVLARLPVRQWVLTLPYRLRYLMAFDHELCRAVLGVYVRALLGFYRRRARQAGIEAGQGGAVTVIQRFGSALNLNVHFHTLAIDGVVTADGRVHEAPPPTDEEVARVLARVRRRILRLLERRGLSVEGEAAPVDPVAAESPALAGLAGASVQGRIALGRRSGHRVHRLGNDPDAPFVLSTGPRQAHIEGFDLHANLGVRAGDRTRLEHLCRYLLRPPVPERRLERLADGRIALALGRTWSDGTTHYVFEPLELLERLALLVPRPRINMVLYHGVLAGHADRRSAAVAEAPGSEPAGVPQAEVEAARPMAGGAEPEAPSATPTDRRGEAAGEEPGGEGVARRRHWRWADLMRRTFDIDVLACRRCGGRMRLIATIEDPEVVRRTLGPRTPDRRAAALPLTRATVASRSLPVRSRLTPSALPSRRAPSGARELGYARRTPFGRRRRLHPPRSSRGRRSSRTRPRRRAANV